MTRTEFNEKTEHYHGRVGGWDIRDYFSQAGFVIGCYYEKDTKMWKTYINYERGRHRVRLETASEEDALDKLYSMIEFENELMSRLKKLDARRKKEE